MKAIFSVLLLGLTAMGEPHAHAQTNVDEVIFKAMNDELARSVTQLKLDKYQPPFYVAYQLADARILTIRATLGEIRQSQLTPLRLQNVRLMVGDYSLNDENFVGNRPESASGGGFLPLPLENNYAAIRRAFWIICDRSYKTALETYAQKMTALKQQNKSDSEKLDDYSKMPATNLVLQGVDFDFDQPRWEKTAKAVSGVFRSYDQVMSSTVLLFFAHASCYLTSNEGAQVKFPAGAACLYVNVFSQAEDGEPLTDHLTYCVPTPSQLPAVADLERDARNLADRLLALRKAPAIADDYSGPVIFEDSAVAELIANKLFDDEGLIATREPIFGVGNENRPSEVNKLDNKINQRICSDKITIKAIPKTKTFRDIPLAGSFDIDAEGVIPADELVLVDKGILKTLLNDRVPTPKVRQSNGHSRAAITRGGFFASQKAPGVIEVTYANGKPRDAFRKDVLEEAAKNGLEFIYAVRQLQAFNPGMNREMYFAAMRNTALAPPVALYRVAVKTGEEQLVRSAVFSDFPVTAFKRISQGCKDPFVYNTASSRNGLEVPVSFIVPQALLFDDVNIEKAKIVKPKPRPVPNPVLAEK